MKFYAFLYENESKFFAIASDGSKTKIYSTPREAFRELEKIEEKIRKLKKEAKSDFNVDDIEILKQRYNTRSTEMAWISTFII